MDALRTTRAEPQHRLLKGEERLKKTSKDFEAVFLSQVVNTMIKDSMPKTMNGGHGEEAFLSMFGDAIAKQMVDQGGIGLAASIETQLRAYEKK